MAFFNKKTVVGISINPELGIEVAQVDFATRTVLKYGVAPLAYDHNRREIADMDAFRGAVIDLLQGMGIPKGTPVSLNVPTITFKVGDYPPQLPQRELMAAFEEELIKHPVFQDREPLIDAVALTDATMQTRKFAFTALQKTDIIEMAVYFKEQGYPVVAIDTGVNSTLNALIYNNGVSISSDRPWIMLQVTSAYARIIAMQGNVYSECFEERVRIGAVLGDEENYSTVVAAVKPYLTRLPFDRLLIVSKTDIISAETLVQHLGFTGQISCIEANSYAKGSFLPVAQGVDEEAARLMSLDVIGAAIKQDFAPYSAAPFNLFNSGLGSIYEDEQPLRFGTFVFTLENCIVGAIIFSLIIVAIAAAVCIPKEQELKTLNDKVKKIEEETAQINAYLKEYNWVSSNQFNEADEVRAGLTHNKNVYSYYTIVGTEIPKKLWLTGLDLGKYVTIKGQADNIESVYSFFRNVNDYNSSAGLSLKKLSMASNSKLTELNDNGEFDANSVLDSMEADFYEFVITNQQEEVKSNGGLPADIVDIGL